MPHWGRRRRDSICNANREVLRISRFGVPNVGNLKIWVFGKSSLYPTVPSRVPPRRAISRVILILFFWRGTQSWIHRVYLSTMTFGPSPTEFLTPYRLYADPEA